MFDESHRTIKHEAFPAPEPPPLTLPITGQVNNLAAEYDAARANEAYWKGVKDEKAAALKTLIEELQLEHADQGYGPDTILEGGMFEVRVTQTETWMLNSRELKKVDPETWVRYANRRVGTRLSVKGRE